MTPASSTELMPAARGGRGQDDASSPPHSLNPNRQHGRAIASLHEAGEMTRRKQTVHLRADFLRSHSRPGDIMDAGDDLASLHRLAEIDHRLDHAVVFGEAE